MNAGLPSALSPMEAEVSRALPLKQGQIIALCKGAQKAGHVPVVEIDGVRVLLIPADHAILKPSEVKRVDEKGKGYL